ncbi:hypothetical protein ACGFZK_21455 [Streptomyces sp. NPDC048257]|uniref:hypothetical protein n=1 Tax=Streptomyces sp. NPDC048257 TaxID=3365526 RepID=UPI00371B2113
MPPSSPTRHFQRLTVRTAAGFGAFDPTVDLVIGPDLSRHQWASLDEYARLWRLDMLTEAEHQAVDAGRARRHTTSPS